MSGGILLPAILAPASASLKQLNITSRTSPVAIRRHGGTNRGGNATQLVETSPRVTGTDRGQVGRWRGHRRALAAPSYSTLNLGGEYYLSENSLWLIFSSPAKQRKNLLIFSILGFFFYNKTRSLQLRRETDKNSCVLY